MKHLKYFHQLNESFFKKLFNYALSKSNKIFFPKEYKKMRRIEETMGFLTSYNLLKIINAYDELHNIQNRSSEISKKDMIHADYEEYEQLEKKFEKYQTIFHSEIEKFILEYYKRKGRDLSEDVNELCDFIRSLDKNKFPNIQKAENFVYNVQLFLNASNFEKDITSKINDLKNLL